MCSTEHPVSSCLQNSQLAVLCWGDITKTACTSKFHKFSYLPSPPCTSPSHSALNMGTSCLYKGEQKSKKEFELCYKLKTVLNHKQLIEAMWGILLKWHHHSMELMPNKVGHKFLNIKKQIHTISSLCAVK